MDKDLTGKLRKLWENVRKELKENFSQGLIELKTAEIISDMAKPLPEEISSLEKEIYAITARKGIEYAKKVLERGDYQSAVEAIKFACEHAYKADQCVSPEAASLLEMAGALGFQKELEKARNALHQNPIIAIPLWVHYLNNAMQYAEKANIDYFQQIKQPMTEDYKQLSEKLIALAEYATELREPIDTIIDKIYAYASLTGMPVPEKALEFRQRASGKSSYAKSPHAMVRIN